MTTLLGRRRPASEPGEMSRIALPEGARSLNVREVPRCRMVVVAHCQTRHPEGRVFFGAWRVFDFVATLSQPVGE